ncbi:MAG: hypothetical protein J2P18_20690 [Nocardia sp.]|nr:hypothetical protein [Nocardia sp.]
MGDLTDYAAGDVLFPEPAGPFRFAPVDSYDELGAVDDRIEVLRHDLARIYRQFCRLAARPAELAVDDLGRAIEPAEAVAEVVYNLADVDRFVYLAQSRLVVAHGYAGRLKLTDRAAAELDEFGEVLTEAQRRETEGAPRDRAPVSDE